MSLAGGIITGLIGAGGFLFLRQEAQRSQSKWVAQVLAKGIDKPIINIGCRRDKWGDVRCDIQPRGGAVYCNALDTGFPDKTFSVAYLSHLLEHTDCPEAVIKEAQRIADNVVVVLPNPFDIPTWVAPDHKWVFFGADKIAIDSRITASIVGTLFLGLTVGLVAAKTRNRE